MKLNEPKKDCSQEIYPMTRSQVYNRNLFSFQQIHNNKMCDKVLVLKMIFNFYSHEGKKKPFY